MAAAGPGSRSAPDPGSGGGGLARGAECVGPTRAVAPTAAKVHAPSEPARRPRARSGPVRLPDSGSWARTVGWVLRLCTHREGECPLDGAAAAGGPAGRVVPHFQPIVELRSRPASSTGPWRPVPTVEALARFEAVDGAVSCPAVWLAGLATSELAGCLLERVLVESAAALHQLDSVAGDGPQARAAGVSGTGVSVNVPAWLLADPGTVPAILDRWDALGLAPDRLVVEVLEDFTEDERSLVAAVRDLRAAGALVAVDDFGAGCSTLRRVMLLTPDVVKLDRGFIGAPGGGPPGERVGVWCPAVRAAAEVSAAVGATLVAEGVEYAGQAAVLSRLGVTRGQGFWWSPAVPAEDLAAVLRDAPARR